MIPTALALLLADAAPSASDGLKQMFLMLGGVLLIFYFLAWRPQAKERREREAMLAAMKKGDHVLTSSGIYGVVSSVKDDQVVLEIDEKGQVRVRFNRAAVQTVLSKDSKGKGEKSSSED